MEFPPSCRTQLFCKLQTHFYSLAFHRLCLSWKHQGASPESVWQHPPPPYNFLPSEGWSREARRLCFYVAWRNQQSHAGNLPGVQRWEFEHLGEAAVECDQEHFVKYWNEVQLCGTFTSVFPFFFWGFQRPFQENVWLSAPLHLFWYLSSWATLQIACCVRANTAPFLIHFFYCQWNHQKRKAHNNGANNQKNAECQIWCS